jgi:MFS transporter, DHA2 family, metal-tetracycline-proton antiporter
MRDRPGTELKKERAIIPWISYLIFFAVLNETMFNVSTPMISSRFSLTPSGVSWMMTIFMVCFGVGSVLFGRLSDIFGLRALIRAGVAIYVAGSIAGFAFQSFYPAVLAARAVQGLGGSAIPALVFVVIARRFEASQRGRVFGLITSVVSLAIGFGPVIGGFISNELGWPKLFLVPILILVALPFLDRLLGREERRVGSVDILGAALTAGTVGSLVLFLNLGSLAFLGAAVLLSVLLLARIRLAENPFIDPALFANSGFRSGLAAAFGLFAIVLGVVFLVPLMLSKVHGLGAQAIGLVLFPGAISSVVFGPIAGRITDRRGSGPAIAAGLSLLVAGMLLMSLLLGLSPIVTAAAMLLVYIGFALFQTAMVNAVSQALPNEDMGGGMGLFNLVGIISGAIGTALVGKTLDGGWLGFRLMPFSASEAGQSYENIMLLLALAAALGGSLYLRALRHPARVQALPAPEAEIDPSSGCLEPSGC